MMLASKHKRTVVEACNLLVRMGTQKSLPGLRKLARSKDSSVRRAATMAGRAIAARK